MSRNVVVRGKWKVIEVEPSMFLQKDMNHLISIEELTDYNIIDGRNLEVLCTSYYIPYYRSHWFPNQNIVSVCS